MCNCFLVSDYLSIMFAKKLKFLTPSPCEYATIHFGAYPPTLSTHTYTN